MNKFNSNLLKSTFVIALSGASIGFNAETLLAASVELGLVVDGSGSVSGGDFAFQRDAYVNIFTNDFAGNFLTGDVDTVFVSFWQFSSGLDLEVDWTAITNNAEAIAFANLIAPVTQNGGGTNTGGAISGVAASILSNAFDGDSEVIDISTDGSPNSQTAAESAASAAFLDNGIVTNTLFVGTSTSGAASNAAIATAGGGTAFTANSFAEYEVALVEKLEAEIIDPDPSPPVPEPGTILGLLAVGGLGLGLKRKKQ
ncbi:PEP-CTERM sorting domain-containing protein [Crocosphaera sp. Alani8]|uniref:PEP-CTERM sorting domain-containing protein n=1 Tax=Crocosphaera sp. Alani8 TaxID=3038952 RepID=UPI00313D3553